MAAIDKARADKLRFQIMAERLEDEADKLYAVNSFEAIKDAKAKIAEADRCLGKVRGITERLLPKLKAKLAELQTMELPCCQGGDGVPK